MNIHSVSLRFLYLRVIVIPIFSFQIYAANMQKPEKSISLQVKDLKYWRNSRQASAIKQSISALVIAPSDFLRIAEPFKNAKKYRHLYKSPFLVMEAEPNDFGGFWALIVFKGYPKVLSIWVYEIDKNVFEIREIEPLKVTLNKLIMNELEDKRIAPFWITL